MARRRRSKTSILGAYRTSETDRRISQNHRRNLIRAAKAALKWAEEQEHIDRSPIRHVKVPAAVPRRQGRSLAGWRRWIGCQVGRIAVC